jgi:hypothetical protein
MVQDLEVDALRLEGLGDLAQMQGEARQPVEAGDDERIAGPDILQAGFGAGPRSGRAPMLFLEDEVAAGSSRVGHRGSV